MFYCFNFLDFFKFLTVQEFFSYKHNINRGSPMTEKKELAREGLSL